MSSDDRYLSDSLHEFQSESKGYCGIDWLPRSSPPADRNSYVFGEKEHPGANKTTQLNNRTKKWLQSNLKIHAWGNYNSTAQKPNRKIEADEPHNFIEWGSLDQLASYPAVGDHVCKPLSQEHPQRYQIWPPRWLQKFYCTRPIEEQDGVKIQVWWEIE